MTETQRKWLTEYLGDEWLPSFQFDVSNRTFTTIQDKQDLLGYLESGLLIIMPSDT